MESCIALVGVDCKSVTVSNWNRIQAKIKGIQSTFAHFFNIDNDGAMKTLIIPIINALHCFCVFNTIIHCNALHEEDLE